MYQENRDRPRLLVHFWFKEQKSAYLSKKGKRDKRGKSTDLINKLFGEVFQFGTVVADEVAIGVEFFAELDGRIDAKVLLEVGRCRQPHPKIIHTHESK